MSIKIKSKKYPWYIGVFVPRPLVINNQKIYDLRLYDVATLEDCGDDVARPVGFPEDKIPELAELENILEEHISQSALIKNC